MIRTERKQTVGESHSASVRGGAQLDHPAAMHGRELERSRRDSSSMQIALIHDYLNQYGGAERVLEVLHDMFPSAPVFTSIYAKNMMPARFRQWDVRMSF